MTTATAQLCGHRWFRPWCTVWLMSGIHVCDEPADHPVPCRCRCGATTRPEGEHR